MHYNGTYARFLPHCFSIVSGPSFHHKSPSRYSAELLHDDRHKGTLVYCYEGHDDIYCIGYIPKNDYRNFLIGYFGNCFWVWVHILFCLHYFKRYCCNKLPMLCQKAYLWCYYSINPTYLLIIFFQSDIDRNTIDCFHVFVCAIKSQ